MEIQRFCQILNTDFYTGVPDSQLKALCDYLMMYYGIDPKHHIIAANEGNCTALAAGYHLATGKIPAVYLQNSGIGNIINPVASLLHEKVYAIPMIFIVGWRGEPGVHDEPQHIFQGEVTLKLLSDMGIAAFVVEPATTEQELAAAMKHFRSLLAQGKQAAIVVRKGALHYKDSADYHNDVMLPREEAIRNIAVAAGCDVIVSTTGKASRELFEIREQSGQGHEHDFLTVGSMGHASSIALGIAWQKPDTRVWCIDGDGSALMQMGAMAVIGSQKPANLIHIILNNGAHETVGGMPTVAGGIDLVGVAKSCGYPATVRVEDREALNKELALAKQRQALSLIEVCCSIYSRKNLGRPTISSKQNKSNFQKFLCIS